MTEASALSKTATTPVSLLAGMAVASPVALNIFAPVMPELTIEFQTTPFTIQLGFTLYLFTLAIGQLISGPLVDRFGRRPVLICGFMLHVFGCLLGAVATEVWQLLLARILQAAGGCTGMLLARSIVLDQHGKDHAAGMLGYITLGIASAQAVAPTIGGYLNLVAGWQAVFWLSMVLGTIVWLGALFYLPESNSVKGNIRNSKPEQQGFRSIFWPYVEVLASRRFIYFAISSTLIASGFFVFITSAPFVVADYLQGDSADYGNWFLLVASGFWLGSLIAGKASARLGTDKMISLGNVISLCGAVLMLLLILAVDFGYLEIFLPMALFTFGRGLSQPNAQATAISSTKRGVATATGLQGFIQLIIGAAMAQLALLLIELHLVFLPGFLALLVVLAVITHRIGRRA